jgi:antirestriction protein ArdC
MTASTRRPEVLETLTAGIARLTNSDAWQDWLNVQSRFHRYSFHNSLLIQLQCPGATHVAGFHAWRKLGRFVRKGEKGIWILAPVTKRVDDDDSDDKVRTVVAFRAVAVFNISQTDGDELPAVCKRLEGDDSTQAYRGLVDVAPSIGYSVEDADFSGEKNGDCAFDMRRIRVRAGNSSAQRVKTLAHELAHALLHEGFNDRALAELEAESVAYVVCSALGLDSDVYTFGYVAVWSGGGDEAIAAIKSAGTRIQQTADSILTKLEAADRAPASAA